MRIIKVTIDNFKIYKHQEFEFSDNRLILVTGANGFGKTTMIDAIEWCLTGDIARIKKCYEERNTRQAERDRAENKKGIIKNSDCKPQDKIKVMLSLSVDNIVVNVFREQKEDSLYVETELQFSEEVSDEIKDRVKRFAANNNFYNYHVCDMYKSYEFMNCKRQEVKEKFEDFIKPHPLADSFSKKLEELQTELNKKIEDQSKNLILQDIIETENSSLESLKSELKIIDYPQVKIYEEENLNIEKETIENIKNQLNKIKKCGYNTVASKLAEIIAFYKVKEKSKKISQLIEIAYNKESDLNIAIKNSYHSIEKLEEIISNIKAVSDEKKKAENAKGLSDVDTSLKPEFYTEIGDIIKTKTDAIKSIEAELKKRQDEIRDKEKGNDIISAMSNLIVGRTSFIKYKNEGNNRCPLCGSDEKFQNISQASELAVEADAYLKKSKSDLAEMKNNEKAVVEKLNGEFKQYKTYIIEHLEGKLKVFEGQKKNFNDYYSKTKDFFEMLKEVNIPVDENCIENIKKSNVELVTKLLANESIINSELEMLKNTLTAVQYSYNLDNITIEKLEEIQVGINGLRDDTISVSNFAFEIFNKKLLFINNILNNNKIIEKESLIKKYEEANTRIRNDIAKLEGQKNKAKEDRDEIEKKKAEIEKLELDAVGSYLYKIFTKVIKHTIIEEFKFNRDSSIREGGATFTDQNKNNILNVLSQGQFGVFMLSYFFANMFKRKAETEFKSYFVDDITNCMDDMNTLSFVDMIKYQLYQKDGVINQFFFSTCNDDLEKLVIHKMKSFNIKFINIKFNSYASGEIYNNKGQLQHFGSN